MEHETTETEIVSPTGVRFHIGERVAIGQDGYYRKADDPLIYRRIVDYYPGSWDMKADSTQSAYFRFDDGTMARPWLVQKAQEITFSLEAYREMCAAYAVFRDLLRRSVLDDISQPLREEVCSALDAHFQSPETLVNQRETNGTDYPADPDAQNRLCLER
jgi:hypothetical protein